MTVAGGIDRLASIPACNIQVMGGQKKTMLGFSSGMQDRNRGLFANLEMVQKAPAKF
jgi:U4/U6 small nuclear ribonucleoprotein PRP31